MSYTTTTSPTTRRLADDKVLKEAKERFERCVGWETPWRDRALFDTKFANGDSANMWQWDTNVRSERGSRPSLTYNQVRQHNLQVQNDARQNKAQIKVTPTGGRASYEAAQVFSGIIRRIEYRVRPSMHLQRFTTSRERHRLRPRRNRLCDNKFDLTCGYGASPIRAAPTWTRIASA
jgi:hypothetical protein